MQKRFWLFPLFAVILLLGLVACGDDDNNAPAAPTLSGTASAGAAMPSGTVITIKGANGSSVTTVVGANGAYSAAVGTLTPPYIVKAESLSNIFYALANAAGTVNVNPFTNLAVVNSAPSNDPTALFTNFNTLGTTTLATNYNSAVNAIVTKFGTFGSIPVTTAFQSGNITIGQGVDAIFDHIDISVSGGTVTITNTDNNTTIGSYSGGNLTGMAMSNIPTITVVVTPANCDNGYVGSLLDFQMGTTTCNQITVCASSQTNIYYVVGGTRINIDYARWTNPAAPDYATYVMGIATQIANACQ